MTLLPPFDQAGNWFKGNLHTHTTQSDGRRTPSENMQWHADHGYDFLAITDHNRITDPGKFMAKPPLLTIPSLEYSAQRGLTQYHILSIGLNAMPFPYPRDPQETIDAVTAAGGVAIIAHPYWHDHTLDDLITLEGCAGIEIFNANCWLEISKGHSLVHWDLLLRRGRVLWGFAADDSHFRIPDHGRAWINVRAEMLDQASILQALCQGQFYATMGPEILDVQLDGRDVTVRCSPARSIHVLGDMRNCPHGAQSWDGKPLTEATLTLHQGQRYVRVEVVDMEGRSAWTNPFFMQ